MKVNVIGDRWVEIRALREKGGQAAVIEVKSVNGGDRRYVLKKPNLKHSGLRTPEIARARFENEVNTLLSVGKLGCQNILHIIDCDLNDDEPWYVAPLYSAGAMWEKHRRPQYLEPYVGKIERVLAICRDVASALLVLQEAFPGFVHRDVKCGNIFFEHADGPAILGDFGLIYTEDRKANRNTPVQDRLGPAMWRPPELRIGGVDKHNPGSDIYLLGGVVYEALSGGRSIDEVEGSDDYAHEREEYSLRQHTDDPRLPLVNTMLRNMFRRDPRLRLDAKTVVELCDEILSWKPHQTAPAMKSPMSAADIAAAELRNKESRVRDRHWFTEMLTLARSVHEHCGLEGTAPPGEVTKQICCVVGDGYENSLKQRYPGSSWAAVRVLAEFVDATPPAGSNHVLCFCGSHFGKRDSRRDIKREA